MQKFSVESLKQRPLWEHSVVHCGNTLSSTVGTLCRPLWEHWSNCNYNKFLNEKNAAINTSTCIFREVSIICTKSIRINDGLLYSTSIRSHVR